MNVRKRTGAMGGLSTTQDPTSNASKNTTSYRGKFYKENVPLPIKNSVAVKPKSVGPSGAANSVTRPGKFSY